MDGNWAQSLNCQANTKRIATSSVTIYLLHHMRGQKWRIVIKLCLGVDVAKSEDEEFSVVDAVEFSPESLDFRVY